MFTSIEQFEKMWLSESGFTRKIMDALTDQSLSQSICEGHRTLGRIAWHICETIPEMMNQIGLKLELLTPPVSTEAKVMQEKYARSSQALLEQVKSGWTDETLQKEDNLYGETWKKGVTLTVLIQHEIHHRGQMTILMRQAGLIVPDIYGPAKEGWSKYNAKPPEI